MLRTMQHSPANGALTRAIAKSPTGIQGLDEITNGGLPRGRPTLVCGGAGSGKTLGDLSNPQRVLAGLSIDVASGNA
jgi:circadian clock protein KaiC